MTKSQKPTYPVKIHRLAILSLALIGVNTAKAAINVTADFDTPVLTTSANVLNYNEEGFRFNYIRPFVTLVHVAPDRTDLYNGSQTLYDRFGGGMIIERMDGGIFTPFSIGIDGNQTNAPALLFQGFYENGDSFTQTFFGDSTLGQETVTFDNTTTISSGVGFNDIVRLEMVPLNGVAFQIDNFNAEFVAVPEPNSAFALGVIALASMGISRRRRHRR